MSSAASAASSTVCACLPEGTGTPWRANTCFPWYSRRSMRGCTLVREWTRSALARGADDDRAQPCPRGIMARAMAIPKDITFVTFDVYGTLIDWETGAYDAFKAEADRDGFTIERDELIPLFYEVQKQIQAGSYELYAEVLRRTAVQIAKTLGWPLEPSRAGLPARLGAALAAVQGDQPGAAEDRQEVQGRADFEHRRQAARARPAATFRSTSTWSSPPSRSAPTSPTRRTSPSASGGSAARRAGSTSPPATTTTSSRASSARSRWSGSTATRSRSSPTRRSRTQRSPVCARR